MLSSNTFDQIGNPSEIVAGADPITETLMATAGLVGLNAEESTTVQNPVCQ